MDTIISLLAESHRRFPDRAALRQKSGGAWREVSYGELSAASDRIAAGLARGGFRAGDHAALLAPSSPRWVMACAGILKAGGTAIPIDKELKSAELRHILTDCGARVLFTERPWLDTVLAMGDGLPALSRVVALDPSPQPEGGAVSTFEELLAATPLPPVPRTPADTALILYTSGTTGRSKGAMLSHGNIAANIRGAIAHFGLDKTVHTLSFLPINHVYELVCGVLLPLSLGGRVSFCESFKKLGENLAEVRPTLFLGVPAVYRVLLDRIMKNIGARPLSRLLFSLPLTRPLVAAKVREAFAPRTLFISGGAALDPAVADGFARLGLTLCQGYGITETSPIIAAECPGARRAGTTGRALPGVEVRIDNPGGEMVGEILVRGPNVMQGYYRNPGATAEVLADGWYRTGDLGRLDCDGFLTICGRAKNLIVTPNGRNVYPEELENELLKSPYIAEAMVYGHKLAPAEEEVRALVYPDREALDDYVRRAGSGPLTAAELESLIRGEVAAACAGLAPYKRIKKFAIREEEFPKTTTRKIKRFAVEAGAAGGP